MRLRRTTASLVAAAAVATGAVAAAPAANASAPGTNSLANVLLSDGDTFDDNRNDFDIVTQAALAVLACEARLARQGPDRRHHGRSPRSSRATRPSACSSTRPPGSGSRARRACSTPSRASASTPSRPSCSTTSSPAPRSTALTALKADGAVLTTAADAPLTVDIVPNRKIELRDLDPDATDARVRWDAYDINKGNLQIAHGIDRVLRPLDLPKA